MIRVRLIILIPFFLVGCGSSAAPLEPGEPGFRCVYTADALDSGRYLLFLPAVESASDSKLPVLLFLHGNGENGTNGVTQIHNNFGPQLARMQEYFPFIGVCVQTTNERRWTPDGQQMKHVLKILDNVLKAHNGDPDRVILTGVSSGGSGAWMNAVANPEHFAAVVPIAASSPRSLDLSPLSHAGLPIWAIYNAGDDGVAIGARSDRTTLMDMGLSPHFTEYQQDGHNAWDLALMNKTMFRWCLQQHRTRRQGKFQLVDADELAADSGWSLDTTGSLTADSAIPSRLSLPVAGEVHFDVWPSPETELRFVIMDEQLKFEISLPDVRSGIASFRSTGDDKWQAKIDYVCHQHLTAGEWNDIRIEINGETVTLEVNGCPNRLDLPAEIHGVQVGILPPSTGKLAVRNVRCQVDFSDQSKEQDDE